MEQTLQDLLRRRQSALGESTDANGDAGVPQPPILRPVEAHQRPAEDVVDLTSDQPNIIPTPSPALLPQSFAPYVNNQPMSNIAQQQMQVITQGLDWARTQQQHPSAQRPPLPFNTMDPSTHTIFPHPLFPNTYPVQTNPAALPIPQHVLYQRQLERLRLQQQIAQREQELAQQQQQQQQQQHISDIDTHRPAAPPATTHTTATANAAPAPLPAPGPHSAPDLLVVVRHANVLRHAGVHLGTEQKEIMKNAYADLMAMYYSGRLPPSLYLSSLPPLPMSRPQALPLPGQPPAPITQPFRVPPSSSSSMVTANDNAQEAFKAIIEGLEAAGAKKDEFSPEFLEKFEGRLTTPLLRHQRLALTWMIRRECSKTTPQGGILADDQGLGKTVSTIALIVSQPREEDERIYVLEENKDEEEKDDEGSDNEDNDNDNDDDVVLIDVTPSELERELAGKGKKPPTHAATKTHKNKSGPSSASPSPPPPISSSHIKECLGGTLVICPSTVLYQWEEEIKTKTPRKRTEYGDPRVYIYHGKSKGVLPATLARFQVVLTTYATMAQELPESKKPANKQMYAGDGPIDLAAEEEAELSGKKKRKRELSGGPLFQIRWHRVVLDEAQVIKNYRTLAAHAAWALHADRRWCLSGTPVQNSIDDLYSYFRFLHYHPYNKYSIFKELIKDPIAKDNPETGFRRLRLILQNILLRRTKTTKIDGEPIISLPERKVRLLQKEFNPKEKAFYDSLEKETNLKMKRLQSEGVLGQNYVNILWMLLRLRQACNHPRLVRRPLTASLGDDGEGSNARGGSGRGDHHHRRRADTAAEEKAAKKLGYQLRESLAASFDNNLTVCVACKDIPEDPVISVCGHIFCRQCVYAATSTAGQDKDESALDFHCPSCRRALHKQDTFGRESLDVLETGNPPRIDTTNSNNNDDDDNQGLYSQQDWVSSTKIDALMEVLRDLRVGKKKKKSVPDSLLLDTPANANDASSSEDNNNNNNNNRPMVRNLSLAKLGAALGRGSGSNLHKHLSTAGMPSSSTGSGWGDGRNDYSTADPPMEKVIVFSQWTSMLDLIEIALKKEKYDFRRLDGTQSLAARQSAIKDFTRMPHVTVMVVSLKAASLGVNLVSANHVVLMDLWYNPSTEDQAIDRAHRIGQTKPVNVTRITIKGSVEDRILELQQKKQQMVTSALGGEGVEGGFGARLSLGDIMSLFGISSNE